VKPPFVPEQQVNAAPLDAIGEFEESNVRAWLACALVVVEVTLLL
jgi:hypothetical protein